MFGCALGYDTRMVDLRTPSPSFEKFVMFPPLGEYLSECQRILNRGLSSSYPQTGGNSQIGETSVFSTADRAKSTDYSSKDNPRILPADFGGHEKKKIAVNRKSCAKIHVSNRLRDYKCPITTSLSSRERITLGSGDLQFENKKRELLGSYRQEGVTQSVVTPKCLGGPPVDRDQRNAHPGCKASDNFWVLIAVKCVDEGHTHM
ncbi:hypothetical protein TNCV_4811331 [Trichonephila clavipes]|nr:hypothetical protein TNCV_4811331 [Trichonephila clavipes]